MTTAPVMTINEELLAELEFLAVATDGWYSEHWSDMTLHADEDVAFVRKASPCAIPALIAHIRSLEARLGKADKDAQRYQWLASHASLDATDGCAWDFPYIDDWDLRPGPNVNKRFSDIHAAIDAAIAQEGADHE